MSIVYKSSKGNPVTNSLLVAERFGKEHKNVMQAINNLVAENSAAKFFHKGLYNNRGKQYPMYLMNRDGFSLLVMGFTGSEALQFKIEFIEAFNRMEHALKSNIVSLPNFNNPIEAARAWADQTEKKQLAEAKIKEMEPKALFADAVAGSGSSILMKDMATILKQNGVDIGQNRLFQYLRENGYLCKSGERYNKPTQYAMELNLFELKETTVLTADSQNRVVTTTKVTGKGQSYFINHFLKKEAI